MPFCFCISVYKQLNFNAEKLNAENKKDMSNFTHLPFGKLKIAATLTVIHEIKLPKQKIK